MSGDAIVLRSLITSLPAGLVPIMSANSQFSSALLPAALSSAGIFFTTKYTHLNMYCTLAFKLSVLVSLEQLEMFASSATRLHFCSVKASYHEFSNSTCGVLM